ncbi:MAG: Fic family protein [Planctomycetota bacterium]
MVKNRYFTEGLIETKFEPGSGKRVLKNLLGIKSKRVLDQQEAEAFLKTEQWSVRYFSRNHRFTENDIRKIHQVFLSKIYEWAGNYRNVNLQKDSFPFAPARQIPRLMKEFSRDILTQYTPCLFKETEKVIEAISIVHTELLLIHPYREGNGRTTRLLADLMALQADLPPLDFSFIKGQAKDEYYRAVQSGLSKNYEPIKKIIRIALQRGLRLVDK